LPMSVNIIPTGIVAVIPSGFYGTIVANQLSLSTQIDINQNHSK
jgi:hypothetical protein